MPIKVLLIEDNKGDARLFEEMVKELNLEIDDKIELFHLDSLRSDLKDFLKNKAIDIVFLDLGLPGSMGKDTVKRFKKIDKKVTLVAYTGMNDITLGADLLHLGADDYICKFDATSSLLMKTIWLNLERSKLQKTLREKENMLLAQSKSAAMGDMVSMIAHQWKQPLSVLAMGLNNMQLDIELGDTISHDYLLEYIHETSEQITLLSSTIDDFKDFFLPNKQKQKTTIKDTVESTLKLIGKSLTNNDIEIVKKYEYIDTVKIYASELVQVLINILKNGKEAILEHGKNSDKKVITIRIYQKKNNVHIQIEDTAGGIPQDILPKIFDPYFTTKGKMNGTGIGLYMSKTIIEDHFKGSIQATNTKNGAKFSIVFPI